MLCLFLVGLPGAAEPPLYVYASVGDNQWLCDWPPIDSPATVDALFDWLSRTYRAKRVYWRGEQDCMWLESYRFRPENPRYHEFCNDWLRHLDGEVGTNRLAVAAAKRRGMEMWAWDGLFEHGAQGEAGGCGSLPYGAEDRLRIEHPEWRPVDRWGQRAGAGPIELCYPEARRALVQRYVHHVVDHGYDGICFYTYVENFRQRYPDEFGYNEPIVAEFKRRHGVDIRNQPFDHAAWATLRGEYVTQLLRELSAELKPRGKKLGMCLRGDQPHQPQRWSATRQLTPAAGSIDMDWETWVKEGLVDQLMVYGGSDVKFMTTELPAACRPRGVEMALLSGAPFSAEWESCRQAGVRLCTVAARGYGIDHPSTGPVRVEDLSDRDWTRRATALACAAEGTLKLTPEQVAGLAHDPAVLVRREVVRTLGAIKAAGQVAVLEAALSDPELSVRASAAQALAAVHGPDSAAWLLAAVPTSGFQTKQEAIAALAAMKQAAWPALRSSVHHRSWQVRDVAVQALGPSGLPEAEPLLRTALGDRDWRVRHAAATGFGRFRSPETTALLLKALGDREAAVQLAAAKILGDGATQLNAEAKAQVLAALEALFNGYGEGSRRTDAAWGWQVVGSALLACGDEGRARLEALRTDKGDRRLAWWAYEVLYVKQSPYGITPCTEEEAEAAHERYAPEFPGVR
ncbi:MAG: HEAT repeat domain-containing protein [Armatimonadetes bacterium]|nr:HEAT repeat domain-containing protein [Armatimonadota bacterium]